MTDDDKAAEGKAAGRSRLPSIPAALRSGGEPTAPTAPEGNPFALGLPTVAEPTADELEDSTATAEQLAPEPDPDDDIDRQALDDAPATGASTGAGAGAGEWREWLDDGRGTRRAAPRPAWDLPDYDDEAPADITDYFEGTAPPLIDRSGRMAAARRRQREAAQRERGKGPLVALGVVAALVLVVIAVISVALNTGGGPTRSVTAATTTATAAAAAPSTSSTTAAPPHTLTAAGCVQRRDGNRVSGSGPGGTSTGPDVILAFQYAYYVQRSGAAARTYVVDGAAGVPSAADIQLGIDATAPGAQYCVTIHPLSDGRWMVELAETEPGFPPEVFRQIVTTTAVEGRTLITAIAPA